MPRYRVRLGQVLAHGGTVHAEGALVEISRAIAEDGAVSGLVEEVDASGALVAPVPVDDLARFRAHERVSLLRDRLAAAQATVDGLRAQLDGEEQALRDAVAAMTVPVPAPVVAPVKGKKPNDPTPAGTGSNIDG
jgi:hypothetical protein